MSNELWFKTAVELAGLIRDGELSARELLEVHLDQIQRINPQVNAIVTLTDELARSQASAADESQARGEPLGPLHGLPVAHKDLVATAGIRTTWGSPICLMTAAREVTMSYSLAGAGLVRELVIAGHRRRWNRPRVETSCDCVDQLANCLAAIGFSALKEIRRCPSK